MLLSSARRDEHEFYFQKNFKEKYTYEILYIYIVRFSQSE